MCCGAGEAFASLDVRPAQRVLSEEPMLHAHGVLFGPVCPCRLGKLHRGEHHCLRQGSVARHALDRCGGRIAEEAGVDWYLSTLSTRHAGFLHQLGCRLPEARAQILAFSAKAGIWAPNLLAMLHLRRHVHALVLRAAAADGLLCGEPGGSSINTAVGDVRSLAACGAYVWTKLNDRYNFLTLEIYRHIEAIREQRGDYRATEAALEQLDGTMRDRASSMPGQPSAREQRLLGSGRRSCRFGATPPRTRRKNPMRFGFSGGRRN